MHRWYDPGTGRWISEDPIGFAAGDANLYRYVGNGVTALTDPTGLERCLYCSVGPDPNWPLPIPEFPIPSGIPTIVVVPNSQQDLIGVSIMEYFLGRGLEKHYHYPAASMVSKRFMRGTNPFFQDMREWLDHGAKTFCNGVCRNATYSSGIQETAYESTLKDFGLDFLTTYFGMGQPDFRVELVGGYTIRWEATIDCARRKARFRGQLYNVWSLESLTTNPFTREIWFRGGRRVYITVDFDETRKW